MSVNCLCQNILKHGELLKGSDKYLSFDCTDSCVFTYKHYTIVTIDHTKSCGEKIIFINNNTKSRTILDVKANYNAQYFYGLFGDKIIIDAGTGTIRTNYIYCIKNKVIIDSIENIYHRSKIINDKLYFETMMDKKKIEELKLPECNYPVENSGYWEERYYNFKTRKIIVTGKYECKGKLPNR
ncbi:MAG: hypothetical protein ABIJ97_17625 [Bacteroidota bacterium]